MSDLTILHDFINASIVAQDKINQEHEKLIKELQAKVIGLETVKSINHINRDEVNEWHGPHKIEILYKDGTTRTEDYVVDYHSEIAVYESDQCDSKRKYTIYPDNQLIESIWWL